eukprot:CAMPEP_0171182346 /NCGR_PEP_ID=MMETSP0790-20130122/14720_1 /TAXON_ID=2925 /ORGANISM="Alexandrium catenella, Strain OF101" /LENGTH=125 /DNA_ID=CAMNT_0011647297 /DNA_START=45 /DNA_END=422 /DNA_ORIENTATION=-
MAAKGSPLPVLLRRDDRREGGECLAHQALDLHLSALLALHDLASQMVEERALDANLVAERRSGDALAADLRRHLRQPLVPLVHRRLQLPHARLERVVEPLHGGELPLDLSIGELAREVLPRGAPD